jgi:hypothetical protein
MAAQIGIGPDGDTANAPGHGKSANLPKLQEKQ